MPKVLLLPDHIASQIAAGEVVERPASVVKELVENSLDAGASEIEITVSADCRDIRVADNGQGMEPEDAVLAFQRHATSKLRNADDLWSLNTLGFRGEALPSVASISRFTCYTRTQEAATGTKITSSDGQLKATETGCAPGTVMEVSELFYNTPARLKFMKKAATEFGHIEETVQSLAIAYPHVALTLINDGQVVLRTSGLGNLGDAIRESGFFSGKETLMAVAADEASHGLSIHGYLAKPIHFRGDRKGVLTIVNRRAVRCPLTMKALDYAYSDLIPRGRYPLAVVTVQLDPGQVDVNIHPTKKELKYSNGNGLYLAIQRALTRALRQEIVAVANLRTQAQAGDDFASPALHEQIPPAHLSGLASQLDKSFQNFNPAGQAQVETIALVREESGLVPAETIAEARALQETQQISFGDSLSYRVNENNHHVAPYKRDLLPPGVSVSQGGNSTSALDGSYFAGPDIAQRPSVLPVSKHSLERESGQTYELPAGWRFMGYLKNTYIFFETHEGLEIIEQHIAHERTLYERLLKAQNSETPGILSENVQQLVVSAPLSLTADQSDVLKNSQAALERLGFAFTFDEAGQPSVSRLPLQLAQTDYVSAIQKMLEDIATADDTNMELEATKSIACQAAIKNGMPLSQADILKLVSDWLATERRDTCPHGRPVRLKYSMPELFELFHPA